MLSQVSSALSQVSSTLLQVGSVLSQVSSGGRRLGSDVATHTAICFAFQPPRPVGPGFPWLFCNVPALIPSSRKTASIFPWENFCPFLLRMLSKQPGFYAPSVISSHSDSIKAAG